MQQGQKSVRVALAWVMISACMAAVGCGSDIDAEELAPEEWEQASEALVLCQGQSCDGQLPGDLGCKEDMVDTGVGVPIFDANGVRIGGIGLFRSPSCQTVWASTTFYPEGGPRAFKMCAVRRRAVQNDSSCKDYASSMGNDSPMKFANSGKIVFGRVVVNNLATRTPDYIVP